MNSSIQCHDMHECHDAKAWFILIKFINQDTEAGAVTNLPPLQESRPEISTLERKTLDNPLED